VREARRGWGRISALSGRKTFFFPYLRRFFMGSMQGRSTLEERVEKLERAVFKKK
jgi:hypothetical protein